MHDRTHRHPHRTLLLTVGLVVLGCSDSLPPELPALDVNASASPDTILAGDSVTLTALIGDGTVADTMVWLQRPGDVEVGRGSTVRVRILSAGTYEFVVRAVTADGRTGRDSVTATAVANGAPIFTTVTAPLRAWATDTVWLVASAVDPESSAVRLTWTSDRAGLLGEGDSLPWVPGNPLAGPHVLTVSAEDPQGTRRDTVLTMKALSTERVRWSRTIPTSQANYGDALALGDGGTVFVGFQSGHLLTFAAADGTPGWEFKTDANLFDHSTGLTVAPDGRVFVFNFRGTGYGLTPAGGVIWQAQIFGRDPHGRFALSPDGRLYAAGNYIRDAKLAWLLRLDPATGQVLWEAGGGGYSSGPALTAEGVLSVQLFPATLFVDTSGTVISEDTIPGPLPNSVSTGHYMSAAGAGGMVYFPSSTGVLSAVRADGSLAWQTDLLERVGEPVISADGAVYTVTTASMPDTAVAYAFAADGSVKWQTPLSGYSWIPRLALLDNGSVWVAVGRYLSRLSTTDGSVLETIEFPLEISSALAVDGSGTVYLMCGVQQLIALQGPAALDPDAPWPIWRRDNRRTASVPR